MHTAMTPLPRVCQSARAPQASKSVSVHSQLHLSWLPPSCLLLPPHFAREFGVISPPYLKREDGEGYDLPVAGQTDRHRNKHLLLRTTHGRTPQPAQQREKSSSMHTGASVQHLDTRGGLSGYDGHPSCTTVYCSHSVADGLLTGSPSLCPAPCSLLSLSLSHCVQILGVVMLSISLIGYTKNEDMKKQTDVMSALNLQVRRATLFASRGGVGRQAERWTPGTLAGRECMESHTHVHIFVLLSFCAACSGADDHHRGGCGCDGVHLLPGIHGSVLQEHAHTQTRQSPGNWRQSTI